MKIKNAGFTLLVLSIAGVLPAHACAPLAELEKTARVVDESAVIVWDAQTKTQHFIRSATLDGNGDSAGFIVPTPTIPQLAEAKGDPFQRLEEWTKPKIIYKEIPSYRLVSLFSRQPANTFNAAGTDMTASAVEVLETRRVGDFDATVLRATNARALNRWLRKNGYSSPAAFEKWLDVYVQKRWIVTAFKARKKVNLDRVFATSLVRMSFQTPRPFFPYREPQDHQKSATTKKRSLRIYFFAPTRMQAAPGSFNNSKNWPGKIKWADDVNAHVKNSAEWKEIAEACALPLSAFQAAPRLTVFDDASSPRPGSDDVFFTAVANKSTLPPPIIINKPVKKIIFIEFVLVALGGLVGGLFLFQLRRQATR